MEKRVNRNMLLAMTLGVFTVWLSGCVVVVGPDGCRSGTYLGKFERTDTIVESFASHSELVVKTCGSGTIKHVDWPEDFLNVEPGSFHADISKAEEFYGWKPGVNIEDGIRKAVQITGEYNL